MWNLAKKDVTLIEGVSSYFKGKLKKLKINTIRDLLLYHPLRYEDRREFSEIAYVGHDETVVVKGKIGKISEHKSYRKRIRILEVIISDDTGYLKGVFFNGISQLKKVFKVGKEVIFFGKVKMEDYAAIIHPEFEFSGKEQDNLKTGRILPVYGITKGLTQYRIRKFVFDALNTYLPAIEDPVPENVLTELNQKNLRWSIRSMHFPKEIEDPEKAKERLAFDKLFFLELLVGQRYNSYIRTTDIQIKERWHYTKQLYESLPFKLTQDQKDAAREIFNDMEKNMPMHRLLQGDVGTGKTVVALLAMLLAAENGYQSVIMAPTEVLAKQHYKRIKDYLTDFDLDVQLLTGSTKTADRAEIYEKFKTGECMIAVGTHALIQKKVKFKNLGLAVVDEQHRFGVKQRSALKEKGNDIHLLVLTATPIPRSLALTVYGELDVSVIKQKPSQQKPVKTFLRKNSALPKIYDFIKEKLNDKEQAFIIVPLIEESDKLNYKSIEKRFSYLDKNVFPEYRLLTMHGRLKDEEKEDIMNRFRNGEGDILLSTNVIEVGIDIANATVMLVEDAERFGLSQLHQLRGRVGRGHKQSYAVFAASGNCSAQSFEKLKLLEKYGDGFKISEADLELRGPGEFLGIAQSGFSEFLPMHYVMQKPKMIKKIRDTALDIVKKDPELSLPDNRALKIMLERVYLPIWKSVEA